MHSRARPSDGALSWWVMYTTVVGVDCGMGSVAPRTWVVALGRGGGIFPHFLRDCEVQRPSAAPLHPCYLSYPHLPCPPADLSNAFRSFLLLLRLLSLTPTSLARFDIALLTRAASLLFFFFASSPSLLLPCLLVRRRHKPPQTPTPVLVRPGAHHHGHFYPSPASALPVKPTNSVCPDH